MALVTQRIPFGTAIANIYTRHVSEYAMTASLIHEISDRYSVLIVTHNMQQAARVSDYTAFMYLGNLVEYGSTTEMFAKPQLRETNDYVTGRFG